MLPQKSVATAAKTVYIIESFMRIQFDSILLLFGVIFAGLLALRSLKQFIYLSFTLLTLKVVWMALIVIFVLMMVRKKSRSPQKQEREK